MNAASQSRFVVLANPDGRRAALFAAAVQAAGLPPVVIVPWIDWLAGRVNLAGVVRGGDVVRLESPGKDFEVERALLALGVDAEDEEPHAERHQRLSARQVAGLSFDKGLLLPSRQWYLGFRVALKRVRRQLAECPPHRLMNDPDDVAVMFDKPACRNRIADAGVVTPRSLGVIGGYEDLLWRMRRHNTPAVFIKLCHGSSASGVVAFRIGGRDGAKQRAVTTVETVPAEGVTKLYNSRKLRVLTEPRNIAHLIDALAPHRVYAERWLPKAGIDGRTADVRVLMIAGRPRHTVVRLSKSPITNLHLLNDRAGAERLRDNMRPADWQSAMDACRRTMACFPGSLHGGVDLLIGSDLRSHAVLEVNAFGDLLPGVLSGGVDTYAAEIDATMSPLKEVTC